MVRRAVRTYSQIVNDFEKADEYDAHIRAFYEPIAPGATAASASSPRPASATRKHRYSHVLDWNDDVTAIVNVDKHDGGARTGAPAAAVAAFGADRRGRASRALAAALQGAVEAASRLHPSPVPPPPPASRLAERLLRGVHGPLPTPPPPVSHASPNPAPSPEPLAYITSVADLSPRAAWEPSGADPDRIALSRPASARSASTWAAAGVPGGSEYGGHGSPIPSGPANLNTLSGAARLLYYGSSKPRPTRSATCSGGYGRPASAPATKDGRSTPRASLQFPQPGGGYVAGTTAGSASVATGASRRPASALGTSTSASVSRAAGGSATGRPASASVTSAAVPATHAFTTRRRPSSAYPAFSSSSAAAASSHAGTRYSRSAAASPDPDQDAAAAAAGPPRPASASPRSASAATATVSESGAGGAAGVRYLGVLHPEPPAGLARRGSGPSNGILLRDPVGPQLAPPQRRVYMQQPSGAAAAAAAAQAPAAVAPAEGMFVTPHAHGGSAGSAADGTGGRGGGQVGSAAGAGPARAPSPHADSADVPYSSEEAGADLVRVRHSALAAARRALWEQIADSAGLPPDQMQEAAGSAGVSASGGAADPGAYGHGGNAWAPEAPHPAAFQHASDHGGIAGSDSGHAAAAAAALAAQAQGLLHPFASVRSSDSLLALPAEDAWLRSLAGQPLRSVHSADASHALDPQTSAMAPLQASAGSASGAAAAVAAAAPLTPHGSTGGGARPASGRARSASSLGYVVRLAGRSLLQPPLQAPGHGSGPANAGPDPDAAQAEMEQGEEVGAGAGTADAGAQPGASKKVQWGAAVHSPRRSQVASSKDLLRYAREPSGDRLVIVGGDPELGPASGSGVGLPARPGSGGGAAAGRPPRYPAGGSDPPSASGAAAAAEAVLSPRLGAEAAGTAVSGFSIVGDDGEARLPLPLPTEREYYQFAARVERPQDMQGWIFNVYITDITPGSTVARRCCVAGCTSADEQGHLLVPQPPPAAPSAAAAADSASGAFAAGAADASAPPESPTSPTSPAAKLHPPPSSASPDRWQRARSRSQSLAAAAAARGRVISPSDLLPWVSRPEQLERHWLRLEAFALAPVAEKVLDTLVFMGDPSAEPPPEKQQPRLSRLQVVETRGSVGAGGGSNGDGGVGGAGGAGGGMGTIAAAAVLGLRPVSKTGALHVPDGGGGGVGRGSGGGVWPGQRRPHSGRKGQ